MVEFSKEEITAAAEFCLEEGRGTCEGCHFQYNYSMGFRCREVFAKAFLTPTPSPSELSNELDIKSTKFRQELEAINLELERLKEKK